MMKLLFRCPYIKVRSGNRGYAIISVLIGMIILSLFAGSLLHLRQASTYVDRGALYRAKQEAALQAGINAAILGLFDQRPEKRWRVDGVPVSFTFKDTPMTLTVQDENGKIDLNAAGRETLVKVFQAADLGQSEAETFADRVLDWREANDLTHLNGSSDQDYRAHGTTYRPRHGPFQTVDELKLVLGMTAALFERLKPSLTVYSQRPLIDPETAPELALLTLPGMTKSLAQKTILERAGKQSLPSGQSRFVRPGVLDPLLPLDGRAFMIVATSQQGQNKLFHEKVIRITHDPARPFLVLMWK
jgi:general secretion pathway protein K